LKRSLTSQFLASVLVNSIYEMKNYPINLVNTVISPISFLLVIDFVSKGALIGQAIEGGLIMSMFQSGMSLQGDISHLKNDFKLQDMLVSSPASPAVYVVGMAASEIIYSLPAIGILIILGAVYIHPGVFVAAELTAALLLMFFTSVTIGFMFATLSSDIVQSFAWSRLLTTIFTAITPVYYPITYIPLPFRYLAYLSPTTYIAEIMQSSAGYLSLSEGALLTDWGVVVGLAVVLFFIVSRNVRWKEV